MLDKDTIELFTAKISDARKPLVHPFNIDDYTYAIDGHKGIRTLALPEYSENEPLKTKLPDVFENAKQMDSVFYTLEEAFPDLESGIICKICPKCLGSGHSEAEMCHECKGKVVFTLRSDYSEYDVHCNVCETDDDIESDGYIYSESTSVKCKYCCGAGTIPDKDFVFSTSPIFDEDINLVSLIHFRNLSNVQITSNKESNFFYLKFDGGEGIASKLRR